MPRLELIGVRKSGRAPRHALRRACAARLSRAALPACLQGAYSYVLQDENGQIAPHPPPSPPASTYAMIGPSTRTCTIAHRAQYVACSDTEAAQRRAPPLVHRGHYPGASKARTPSRGIKRAPDAKGKVFIVNLVRPRRQGYRYLRGNFKELDSQ